MLTIWGYIVRGSFHLTLMMSFFTAIALELVTQIQNTLVVKKTFCHSCTICQNVFPKT